MANLPPLTDDTFDAEVLGSDSPVLVDFSATWCGPCKQLAPTIEELAGEYAGRVKFFAVDVEEARKTAERYNISSVPTLLFFKGGEIVHQMIGNRPKAELAKILDDRFAVAG